MEKADILQILRKNNSVFTFKDIALIWGETNPRNVQKKIYRYIKAGKLYPIRRGIYAKDKNYNKLELATKIYTPSYISFETVLAEKGVIFQHYSQIFVASYLSREIECDGQKYIFKKIKNSALTDGTGIEKKDNFYAATAERAFLDAIYLYKDYHFDNLESINWDLCFKIVPIYKNNNLKKKLQSYYENYKNA